MAKMLPFISTAKSMLVFLFVHDLAVYFLVTVRKSYISATEAHRNRNTSYEHELAARRLVAFVRYVEIIRKGNSSRGSIAVKRSHGV